MNERSITQKSRAELERRGFVVIKHEDVGTIGVPDMSLTRHGKTLWVEDKYFEYTSIAKHIPAKTICIPDRYPQLMLLTRLSMKGFAEYWIYQNVQGVVYVGRVDPPIVLGSWELNKLVEVHDIMERSEWIRTFEMP